MKEITCNMILDILPLYADGVVSEDTADMVQNHLDGCKGCQRALDAMQSDMTLPIDLGSSSLRKYQTKRKHRKLTIACLSVAGIALAVAAFLYFGVAIGVPISSEDVVITTGFEEGLYTPPAVAADGLPCEEDWRLNRAWNVDIRTKDGRPLVASSKRPVGDDHVISLTQVPRFTKDQADSFNFMFHYPSESPIADDYDFTVTLKFKDRDIVYSMREEGLFDLQEATPGGES